MSKGWYETSVPTKVLRPYIREWIEASGMDEWPAKKAFARASGLATRTVDRVLGETQNVKFDVADKIVSRGLGRPELWFGQLSAYYPTPKRLARDDRRREERAAERAARRLEDAA